MLSSTVMLLIYIYYIYLYILNNIYYIYFWGGFGEFDSSCDPKFLAVSIFMIYLTVSEIAFLSSWPVWILFTKFWIFHKISNFWLGDSSNPDEAKFSSLSSTSYRFREGIFGRSKFWQILQNAGPFASFFWKCAKN